MSEPIALRVARVVGEITAQDPDPVEDAGRSLREMGVTSLRMIELIGILESTFDLRIDDEDIDEEHFGTLSGLIGFVEKKARG